MEELNFKLFYGFLNSIKSFLWIGLIIDETTDSSIKISTCYTDYLFIWLIKL